MDQKQSLKNRITALMLAAVLVTGGSGVLSAVFSYAETGASKEETVYAIKSADGETEKIIVDEILATDVNGPVEDVSFLSEIENLSGDETYTRDGANLVWDAKGNNIRYQGTSDRGLPADLRLSYYLNGKKVNAKEIAGKSGSVEIHFDYDINSSVSVGGGVMDHPYLFASGLSLDHEHFSNISINSGKIIDNGDNSLCMGFAMPGLRDNLGIDAASLTIPESVIVKADTDSFRIDGTYSIAMTGMLSEAGADELAEDAAGMMGQLESGLSQLSSAANKLVKGSSELADGVSQLSSGTQQLESGSVTLTSSIKAIWSGSTELYNGSKELHSATTELKNGAARVDSGVDGLKEGTSQLKEGTEKLSDEMGRFNGYLSELRDGSEELKDGTEALKEGTGELKCASELMNVAADAVLAESAIMKAETILLRRNAGDLEDVTQEVADDLHAAAGDKGMRSRLNSVEKSTDTAINAANDMSDTLDALASEGSGVGSDASGFRSSIAAYRSQLNAAKSLVKDDSKRALIDRALSELSGLDSYLASVESFTNDVESASSNADAVSDEVGSLRSDVSSLGKSEKSGKSDIKDIAEKADKASSKASTVKKQAVAADITASAILVSSGLMVALAHQISDGAEKLDDGAAKVDEGAGKLMNGAQALDEGAKDLREGVLNLDDGAGQVDEGVDALKEGTSALAYGSEKIDSGMSELESGAGRLSGGTGQLAGGTTALLSGVKALSIGAQEAEYGADQLSSGINRFNKEGIQKFVAALGESGIAGMLGRFNSLCEADSIEVFYGGKKEGTAGESRIIFKTAAVSVEAE